MAAAERVRQAMDEAAVDGGGLMPSQILEMIRDGLATVDGADAEVINKALRRAGFDDAFAAELTAELTGEKPSDASRDGAGEARGASRDAGGRAAELVRQAMDETMAEFGDMRPSQILKELRDGLAEAIDGADAEVITAAMRSAGIDDDSGIHAAQTATRAEATSWTRLPTTTARRTSRNGLAPPPPLKKKTTRSSWRRRCAKRWRRWLASRTGRPRRCSS